MSRSTPWGAAQITENHFRGFSTVHTAGHGGMMVSRGAALKYLSSAARKRALMHNNNNYFCYEEDCDALLVLFDAKELRKQLMSGMSFFDNKSDKEIEQYLVTHLTAYHSDYLLELGVSPDLVEFEKVLLRKAYIENIENKSPTTVVACRGDITTLIPGLVIAITADDKTHYVSEASYDAMMTNSTLVITRPLNSLQPLSEPTINISDRVVNYILVKAKPYFD